MWQWLIQQLQRFIDWFLTCGHEETEEEAEIQKMAW